MNSFEPIPDADEARLRAALRGLPLPEVPATLAVAVRGRIAARDRQRVRLRIGGAFAVAAVVLVWVGSFGEPATAPPPVALGREEPAEWFAPPPVARLEVLARQEAAWLAALEPLEESR